MKPGFNLVRWLWLVALGGVLGLFFIFGVLVTKTVKGDREQAREARRAQPLKLSEEHMQQELIRIVESQLTAFRKNDYPKAYSYAAAGFHEKMPLPQFERMVKTGYPALARSRRSDFGVILDNSEAALVNMSVLDNSGGRRYYQYLLQRERGGWKISGVQEVKAGGSAL